MAPRASWKGQLRLSLVAIPIRMYNAVSGATRISLNQLHKDCHLRLKQRMECPEHGPVDRSEIVKGYEYEKDTYVVIDDADLESVKLETTKIIEIVQFVDEKDLDPIFYESPYYVAPDGPVADEAFRVIRTAMNKSGKIAIGRVVLTNREHVIAIKPKGKGMLLSTLRTNAEVREAAPCFEEIRDGEVKKEQLQLAEQLIETLNEPLDITKFNDRYQDALLDVIKAKVKGEPPIQVQEAEPGKVINFMEALMKSVADAPAKGKKKPPAPSVRKAATAKGKALKKKASGA